MQAVVAKSRSLLGVILGLMPRICCLSKIDRMQMLGTGPSMTIEELAAFVSRLKHRDVSLKSGTDVQIRNHLSLSLENGETLRREEGGCLVGFQEVEIG